MAKIQEEVIIIKFSKLVRESSQPESIVTPVLAESIQDVITELAGSGIIVEVERVD
jgi:hypothetical protein